jgi:hypothetical protein
LTLLLCTKTQKKKTNLIKKKKKKRKKKREEKAIKKRLLMIVLSHVGTKEKRWYCMDYDFEFFLLYFNIYHTILYLKYNG